MIGSGIFPIDDKRGFKFGMNAADITEQAAGRNIEGLLKGIIDKEPGRTSLLKKYFYGGAVSYARDNKVDVPDEWDVGNWMQDIGTEKCLEIFNKSLATYPSKNSDSPPGEGSMESNQS